MMNTEMSASRGTVEGMKEEFVRDLKGVVADGDDPLKEVAHSTVEEVAVARTKLEQKLGDAKSRLDDARIAATEKARVAANATQAYVRENPWMALAVAAGAGVVIGFLLNRR